MAECKEIIKFNFQNIEHLNKILNYNQKTVRIFGTNEDPWFCGRDVCEIFEYEKYRDALMNNVDSENKKNLKDLCVQFDWTHNKFHYNEERMTYINEEGLYSLIFACKLPLAKLFKKWVMKEVLPSIRKTGQYKMQQELSEAMKKLELVEKEKEKLQNDIERALEFNQATQTDRTSRVHLCRHK